MGCCRRPGNNIRYYWPALLGLLGLIVAEEMGGGLPSSCASHEELSVGDCVSQLQLGAMSRKVQPDHGGQNNISTIATFREAALPVAAAGPKVFIGIKTAPGNAPRRTAWRESQCGKGLLAAGLQYAFVVGEPLDAGQDLTSHVQGRQSTAHERKLEEELLQEGAQFEDILALPERDDYQDLSNKLLEMYRHGYSQIGASWKPMTIIASSPRPCWRASRSTRPATDPRSCMPAPTCRTGLSTQS